MNLANGLPAFACALVLIGACSITPASATESGKGFVPTAYEPVIPLGGPYDHDYDPAYADGGIFLDRFAGSPGSYEGQKILRLPDGTTISAGTVVIDGAYQLGLVRYSASGRRQTWSSVAAQYSRYNGEYVVFPNNPEGDPKLSYVADIKRYGGNIFVLATQTYRADNGLDKYQPAIVVFSEDGAFRGWWFVRPDQDVYNNPRAMDISGSRLTLLGGNSAGGLWTRFWTARFTIGTDGGLSLDEDFGDLGARMFELPSTVSGCSEAALGGNCPISGIDLAHEANFLLPFDPSFYVAFTKKYNNAGDHDPCIAAFTGSGNLSSAFGSGGVACYPFDDTNSNQEDRAVAIDTDFHAVGSFPPQYVQDIYLLAGVSRQYSSGTGLLRIDSSGDPVTEFGGTGRLLWGGCGDGCSVNLGNDIPLAFARYGANLAIVGHWKPSLVDQPELALADAMDGTIRHFQVHAIPSGDANFVDVVGDPLGFTMTGWARDADGGSNSRMFVTAHMIRTSIADDTIFRYGHE